MRGLIAVYERLMLSKKPTNALITIQSDAYGGVERRMVDETAVLRALGWNVLVAAPKFENRDAWESDILRAGGRLLNWNPYKVIERGHTAIPFRLLAMQSMRTLQVEGIRFAHVPLAWTTVGLSRALALREAHIPYVLIFRCAYGKVDLPKNVRRLISRALEGMVGGYGVSQVALDSFLANFSDLLPNDCPLEVIHNGVDTRRFKPNALARAAVRRSH